MEQAVFKIPLNGRYSTIMYSWNYGVGAERPVSESRCPMMSGTGLGGSAEALLVWDSRISLM